MILIHVLLYQVYHLIGAENIRNLGFLVTQPVTALNTTNEHRDTTICADTAKLAGGVVENSTDTCRKTENSLIQTLLEENKDLRKKLAALALL